MTIIICSKLFCKHNTRGKCQLKEIVIKHDLTCGEFKRDVII